MIPVLNLSIISFIPILVLTVLASGFVALATTYYVKYDAKTQTLGLTIWSIHQAKEWFKGRKLNEREGENVIISWELVENDNELAMAQAIVKLLENPIETQMMTKNARTLVEGFDVAIVKQQWHKLLSE